MHNVTKYKDKPGGAIHVSVGTGEVEKFRQLIGNGKKLREVDGAKFVRMCVESGVLEPVAQKRVKQALDILDSLGNKLLAESARDKLRMALLGCPTTTNTEFTGELSREYIERYGK